MNREKIEAKKQFFKKYFPKKGHINDFYKMKLSFEGDNARFDLDFDKKFTHALNGLHGGVIATLLDNAGWFTAALHYDNWIATVEFNVRLIAHAPGEDVYAIGQLVHSGKRLSVCDMEVRSKKDDRIIAKGSGTFVPTSAKME